MSVNERQPKGSQYLHTGTRLGGCYEKVYLLTEDVV